MNAVNNFKMSDMYIYQTNLHTQKKMSTRNILQPKFDNYI